MNIVHASLLHRLKANLKELIEISASRGPLSSLPRNLVAAVSSKAKLLMSAIEALEGEELKPAG